MRTLLAAAVALAGWAALAQEQPEQVLVSDQGVRSGIAGPGAPAHVVGLERMEHNYVIDTGAIHYGLRYCVAHDPKRPGIAIPGEGYIGMAEPTGFNWYAGGFFDLQINGTSIGGVPIHSLTGRSVGQRGFVDFVFDTPQAVVRIRFVALAGGDALYGQALLEPKVEIKSLRIGLRCYPAGFISAGEKHVLTATRDLKQGARAELDPAAEWWLLCYDQIFDQGYATATHRGQGPCAVLWLGEQVTKVAFTVGGYGIEIPVDLKPDQRDFRFVFFDYKGQKNAAAEADLRRRAPALTEELRGFSFTDTSLADWPLEAKQKEVQEVLATAPDEKELAASYQRWSAELAEQLKLIRSGDAGAIMAEANVAKIVTEWEHGLPTLKLKALLGGI